MQTKNFTFLSKDGKTQIHAVKWTPDDGNCTAVLQITHGMVEYIERYIPFAEYLTKQGYMVVGHDHLGHGESVISRDCWGYFAAPRPSDTVIEDMHRLRTLTQKEAPDLPYFMLGHSMGSFMLRKYLAVYGQGLNGAIVMGTGYIPGAVTGAGLAVVKALTAFKGGRYRSKTVAKMTNGSSYAKFDTTGAVPENSWLTRDAEIVKAYYANPKCTYVFTLNGFQGLFEAVRHSCDPENAKQIPADLPMLIVSGQEDPVGDLGVGVEKTHALYQQAGIKDLTCTLYAEDRHEILNELDKEKVFADLYAWMEARRS